MAVKSGSFRAQIRSHGQRLFFIQMGREHKLSRFFKWAQLNQSVSSKTSPFADGPKQTIKGLDKSPDLQSSVRVRRVVREPKEYVF